VLRQIIQKIIHLAESLIPETVIDEDNYIDYYRKYFISLGSIVGIFVGIIVLILRLDENYSLIASVGIILCALIANLFFLKIDKIKVATYVTAYAFAVGPGITILYDGHFLAKGFLWFLFIPFLLSIFIKGRELAANVVFIVGLFLGLQIYFKPTQEMMMTIQSKMSSVASWQFYILEFLIVLTSILIVITCYNFVNEKTQQLLMKNRSSNEFNAKMSSLGEMAGNIAHEINNPLTIVLGCVFKIKHVTKKELIGEKEINTIVESAQKISVTVERVGEIVNALQNISRKSDNKMAQTYLKEILREVVSITTFKLKEKQIEFTSYFDSDFMFLGDRVQASQVVLNLVNNAFYASEKNSKPKVCIEFDEDADFGYLHIVDNGEGVDKENIDRIFEPLFSTKPVGEGTGIGLAISSTMMKAMGGSIDYSRRDHLTYFTIKLPKFETLES